MSASFEPGDEVPVALIAEWLEESFVAIAPKRLVKERLGGDVGERSVAKKKVAKKKAAKKK